MTIEELKVLIEDAEVMGPDSLDLADQWKLVDCAKALIRLHSETVAGGPRTAVDIAYEIEGI